MLFALGYIAGVATCAFIAAALVFFKSPIERVLKEATTAVASAGPKPRGSIFVPPDEAEAARREIIERNKRQGKDTPVEDLIAS